MTTDAASPFTRLSQTQKLGRWALKTATRRIWLPRFLYDLIPWFYLFSGAAALLATIFVDGWLWILPFYVLFAVICLHLAAVVFDLRRNNGNRENH
jgi:Flp pilus assembly protein TadB